MAEEKALSSLDVSKSEKKVTLDPQQWENHSFTHVSDAPKAMATMLARPPITPGKPCRLWTPHVSWILSLAVKNG